MDKDAVRTFVAHLEKAGRGQNVVGRFNFYNASGEALAVDVYTSKIKTTAQGDIFISSLAIVE